MSLHYTDHAGTAAEIKGRLATTTALQGKESSRYIAAGTHDCCPPGGHAGSATHETQRRCSSLWVHPVRDKRCFWVLSTHTQRGVSLRCVHGYLPDKLGRHAEQGLCEYMWSGPPHRIHVLGLLAVEFHPTPGGLSRISSVRQLHGGSIVVPTGRREISNAAACSGRHSALVSNWLLSLKLHYVPGRLNPGADSALCARVGP